MTDSLISSPCSDSQGSGAIQTLPNSAFGRASGAGTVPHRYRFTPVRTEQFPAV